MRGNSGGGNSSSPSNTNSQNCIPSVLNPSCKPPTCPEVFFKSTFDTLDKFPVFPTGQGPEDAVKATARAAANRHIVNRGLAVSLRSSIVCGILGLGEGVATVAAAVPVIVSEVVGLFDELKAWRAGTCRTIWSK